MNHCDLIHASRSAALAAGLALLLAACGGGSGGDDSDEPSVPISTQPADLKLAAMSESSIQLTWVDQSTDEVAFVIERATSATGPWLQFFVPRDTQAFLDRGLLSATPYFYRVAAQNTAFALSPYLGPASIATLPHSTTVPAAPSNLVATAVSSGSITLSWVDNSSNETSFRIERAAAAAGPFAQIGSVGAGVVTYADGGLANATTYFYRVLASNGVGDSAYTLVDSATTPASTTIPSAPTALAVVKTTSTEVPLTWTDNSNNESGFKIERAAASSGPFSQIATVGAGVVNYSDSGLAPSTQYFYRVRATNSAGDSAYTAVVSAMTGPPPAVGPNAPSSLAAAAVSSSAITLSWTDNSNNESGFQIERATASNGPFSQIATASANAVRYDDSGLTPATQYFYRVRATNLVGESAYTTVASATTKTIVTIPAAPSSLAAAAAATSITLTWLDNSNNESSFRIERAPAAAGPYAEVAVTSANVVMYADTGLTPGTAYFYRMRAANSEGASGYSSVASATTLAPPAAPSALAANGTSPSTVALSWTDNSNNETGFKVERANALTGPFIQIGTTAAGVVSFTNSGLAASTTYYFRVRATNAAGDSAYSNVDSGATQGPTTVTLSPTADNVVMISSTDPARANSVFQTGDLLMGCNWLYSDFTATQDFVCAQSFVRFNVTTLTGKTIDSATLRVVSDFRGVGSSPRPWSVWAIKSAWSPATLTWNIANAQSFQYYIDGRLDNLPLPTFAEQVINLDVKFIVQAWANGSFANNGLFLQVNDLSFPNATSLDAFGLFGLEDPGQEGPRLIVTYR